MREGHRSPRTSVPRTATSLRERLRWRRSLKRLAKAVGSRTEYPQMGSRTGVGFGPMLTTLLDTRWPATEREAHDGRRSDLPRLVAPSCVAVAFPDQNTRDQRSQSTAQSSSGNGPNLQRAIHTHHDLLHEGSKSR